MRIGNFLKNLFFAKSTDIPSAPLYFENTLSGEKEVFVPLRPHEVKMYNCGPTVYGRQHIGNLSMFVFVDILRRTLERNNYAVKQVINFTDMGHLSGDNEGDADTGEDRMTKGLKREGMELTLENMKVLGEKYASLFLEDLKLLNTKTDDTAFPKASEYISEQIDMVRVLMERGYAYKGKQGVYFDTSKFPEYGKLGNINLAGQKEGARVASSNDKRNPTDFLLWKGDQHLGWESPWGKGFPGWHIECSAMAWKLLGKQIDVHTGGIEHIPVHHNNEIAQSESATRKKPFSRFWLHRAHLQIDSKKIAKSEGTAVYLSDLIEKGFDPLAFRYLLLTGHYRSPLNFTWESLEGAAATLKRLRRVYQNGEEGSVDKAFIETVNQALNDDLDTPKALAELWKWISERKDAQGIRPTLRSLDSVLGLQIDKEEIKEDIPETILEKANLREEARAASDWEKADRLRKEITEAGFVVEDTPEGPRVTRT